MRPHTARRPRLALGDGAATRVGLFGPAHPCLKVERVRFKSLPVRRLCLCAGSGLCRFVTNPTLFLISLFCEYIHLEYIGIHVIYRVHLSEYIYHILVVAPQEDVKVYSARRLLHLLWPIQDTLLLLFVCARVNHPFITPACLHYPHYCNTIARLLRNT